ncbi:MAG: MATE family efflux transporter, partial [Pseudomonadota bacterium]|nr:MATE family efflux transporter [Pseudomonadota bacterium]
IAVLVALGFCLSVQAVFSLLASQIAAAFVTDPAVVAKVAVIMPVMLALFVLSGPLMMLAAHFQAIGDARRAAVLSLSKPFAFAIPLTFALPLWFGEMAIWWAVPSSEVLLLLLAVWVLWARARRARLSWGVFTTTEEARS